MTDEIPPLARALGRIPTGLYVVAAATPDGPAGFIASFLVQVGIDPPMVCVAVGRDRGPLKALREAGAFGVSILDGPSRGAMGAFFKSYEPGQGPFDGLETEAAPSGAPVLSEALAWLDCEVVSEHDPGGDHLVVYGKVTAGSQAHEGDPAVHLRKNGLGY